jgi:hypothetical protein
VSHDGESTLEKKKNGVMVMPESAAKGWSLGAAYLVRSLPETAQPPQGMKEPREVASFLVSGPIPASLLHLLVPLAFPRSFFPSEGACLQQRS